MLSVFSKILERLVHDRLSSLFNINKTLTDKQYGFCERHSTYMALLKLSDQITAEIDNKNVAIFIDLSNSFDTIDHAILLDKLSLN